MTLLLQFRRAVGERRVGVELGAVHAGARRADAGEFLLDDAALLVDISPRPNHSVGQRGTAQRASTTLPSQSR